MSTGYTSQIEKGVTFKEFVLSCSRAFGALITMRDDPADTTIPDEIIPSDWNKTELKKAEEQLETLQSMTIEQVEKESFKEYLETINSYREKLRKDNELREKYLAMFNQVKAWQPPTPDHIGLKDFMISQIEQSINFDCIADHIPYPILKTVNEWLSGKIEECLKDIKYHTKEYADEVDRCAQRTAWIKALKQSL